MINNSVKNFIILTYQLERLYTPNYFDEFNKIISAFS